MSGKPRRRALIAELDARTAETFAEDDVPRTHLDYLCAWVADGRTVNALIADLNPAVRARWAQEQDREGAEWNGVTRSILHSYLHDAFGEDETKRRLELAKSAGADALVEEAREIVDAPMETTTEVARANLRLKERHWTAGRYNPAVFGDQKGTNITLNIGQMHLDALKAFPAPSAPIAVLPAAPSEDLPDA